MNEFTAHPALFNINSVFIKHAHAFRLFRAGLKGWLDWIGYVLCISGVVDIVDIDDG